MEFEDQEEHEKEIGLLPSCDSLGNSSRLKMASSGVVGGGTNNHMTSFSVAKKAADTSRYRECQKNHAVGMGGHSVDGCGEFMPAGAEGTLDALKCAACNCHRNFHRKEVDTATAYHNQALFPHYYLHHQQPPSHHQPAVYQFHSYNRTPAGYLHVAAQQQQQRPLALPSTSGGGTQSRGDQEDVSNPSGGSGMMSGNSIGIGIGGQSTKRFRTKFTQEQKDRMLEFAARLGWRIQKQDEAVVQEFCSETGVKRRVLKVWMHNNRHIHGKKP
ncbi:hypothetical protein Nepgr_027141 [Nepenthes gracilis]|uniref:ZF-HD dimerization-type domain-containing protein n=1 Tax=Nepenthes gracilis TaxID=150966 RepID=A0AAD3T9U6_NEPGR|nr:hypothetical protein Nepgr_027141 [Nepenthes gracilis]